MIRNWIVVYLGNFVGGLFIAAVIWFGGQHGSKWSMGFNHFGNRST